MNKQFEENGSLEKNESREERQSATLRNEAGALFDNWKTRHQKPSAAMDYFPSSDELLGKAGDAIPEIEIVGQQFMSASPTELVHEIMREYLMEARKGKEDKIELRKERDAAESLAEALGSGDLNDFKKAWQQAAKNLTEEQIQRIVQKINDAAAKYYINLRIDVNDKGDVYLFNPFGTNVDALKISSNGAVDIVRLVKPVNGDDPYFESVDKVGENRLGEKAREYREIIANANTYSVGGVSFIPALPPPP